MYKQECYKIFSQKSIYIILLLIIGIMIFGNRTVAGDLSLKGEVYDNIFEEWRGPLTEAKLTKAKEKMAESDAGGEGIKTPYEQAEADLHFITGVAGINSQSFKENKQRLTNQLKKTTEGSYKQKLIEKELSMLQNLEDPFGIYLIRAWQGSFDLIEPAITVIFLTTLIILGVTPLFVDEYTNRTMDLVLATKHGRRKIVTAKLLAGISFIAFIFISLHGVNFILQWIKFGGLDGWNAPMQNLSLWSLIDFSASPYDWTIGKFYRISLTLQLLASIGLGMLIIMLSIMLKNTMLTMIASGSIVALPTFFAQFMPEDSFMQIFNAFNYYEWLKSATLFQEFTAYNLLGLPVLYPTLIVTVFSLLTVIITILIYISHNRTEISN